MTNNQLFSVPYILLSLFAFTLLSPVQAGEPEQLWVTEKGLDAPESAYYHPGRDQIYVSNMSGGGEEKDGKGWISILDTDGSVVQKKWVDGLDAPKGIRAVDGTLYVSDIDRLLGFDLDSGEKVVEKTIEDAIFLNDVATAPDGSVYVSDMKDNTIYRYRDGSIDVFARGSKLESPNGLLVTGTTLTVGGWSAGEDKGGHLYTLALDSREKKRISDSLGNLDGVEVNGRGQYIVSDWVAGVVYRLSSDGEPEPILEMDKSTADIGFVHGEQILLVPHMNSSRMIAYQLHSGQK